MSRRTDAYEGGAQHRRAGISLSRTLQNYVTDEEKSYAMMGWRTQQAHPKDRVQYPFFLTHAGCKVCIAAHKQIIKEKTMTTRTKEELDALREDYRVNVYDAYAAQQKDEGFEPQPFDEAFQAHLEALDADNDLPDGNTGPTEADSAPAGADAAKPAAGKTGAKGVSKASGTKAAGGKKADGAKAEKPAKEPKAPKPKSFRPTSDDRKTVNAAGEQALKAAKVEGTPRLKLVDGSPYVEFLQGRALKLDDKGNGSLKLNVTTAADTKTVVGHAVLTVKAGVLTAVGKKGAAA